MLISSFYFKIDQGNAMMYIVCRCPRGINLQDSSSTLEYRISIARIWVEFDLSSTEIIRPFRERAISGRVFSFRQFLSTTVPSKLRLALSWHLKHFTWCSSIITQRYVTVIVRKYMKYIFITDIIFFAIYIWTLHFVLPIYGVKVSGTRTLDSKLIPQL